MPPSAVKPVKAKARNAIWGSHTARKSLRKSKATAKAVHRRPYRKKAKPNVSEMAPQPSTDTNQQTNGGLGEIEDVDAESELSEPDSDAGSPPDIAKEMSANRASPSDTNDQEMRDVAEDEEAPISHYPKRKRNSMYQNLNDNKSDFDVQLEDDKDARNKAPPAKRPASAGRLPVTSTAAMRAVNLGHWRDSPVTEVARKHSVIGFIDARDRLRTRIQTTNSRDEHIAKEYPLPPGPGGSWLTFDKIAFLPHLVSLDQYEVKEYVRTRRDARPDETEAEREKADMEAVEKAQRHLTEHPNIRNPTVQPIIAHGQELPAEQNTGRPESKRRRTSGNFTPIVPANANGTGTDVATPDQPSTPSPVALDPLPGTRPTRILIGYWKGSDQVKEADRHAVYGILGQNDMFRVKLTRETRDGRRVDGNFPAGAGALWIGYDEVAHEPHLKDFNRQEIKEFCRVRQWQMDQAGDEKDEERQDNIKEAALEAKRRVLLLAGNASATRSTPATRSAPGATPLASNTDNDASTANTTSTSGPETPTVNGHSNGTNPEQRQSRRLAEPRNMDRAERADGHTRRQFVDIEPRPASSRAAPSDAVERANALARREIERVEAAQGRADRNAPYRERAARAAAMDAANAAALSAISSSGANGVSGTSGSRLNESEHMQRLNAVWAKQESLRARSGTEDAKVYDGVKYERKATGPFVGKLVSQGHIINIDGEDYVEYRVLTKPSFF